MKTPEELIALVDDRQIKEAVVMIDRWKRMLRLQDWDVQVELGECEGAVSQISNNRHYQNSRITISRWAAQMTTPDHHDQTRELLTEMEESIVHELLHIYFPGMDADTDYFKFLRERGINHLAHILVRWDSRS